MDKVRWGIMSTADIGTVKVIPAMQNSTHCDIQAIASRSIEKAEKQLGFAPKFSNKDALIRNYKWYLENHADFKNKSGISHRVPWKQGILRFAKMFF